jgi:hypothetical protein
MTPTVPNTTPLDAARIEALFLSGLSMHTDNSPEDIKAAIQRAVRQRGGTRACACAVAQEFGDHPDTAATRMRWARAAVATVFTHTHAGDRTLIAA